jgi:hypothetical protein
VKPPPMCGNLLPPFPTQQALDRWRQGGPCPPANYCSNLACTLVSFVDADGAKMFYCSDCFEQLKSACVKNNISGLRVFPLDYVTDPPPP